MSQRLTNAMVEQLYDHLHRDQERSINRRGHRTVAAFLLVFAVVATMLTMGERHEVSTRLIPFGSFAIFFLSSRVFPNRLVTRIVAGVAVQVIILPIFFIHSSVLISGFLYFPAIAVLLVYEDWKTVLGSGFVGLMLTALMFFLMVFHLIPETGVLAELGHRHRILTLAIQLVFTGGIAFTAFVLRSLTLREGAARVDYEKTLEELERLKRNDARLYRLVDSSLIGIAFWNANGVVTEANDRFLTLTGSTREELSSGRLQWHEIVADAAMPDGSEGAGHRTQHETICRKNDGTTIPVIVGSTWTDARQTESASLVVDISERRRAQIAHHESELRFKSVFERSPLGMVILDHHGTILRANSHFRSLLGLGNTQPIGKTIEEFIASTDLKRFRDVIESLGPEPARDYNIECEFTRTGGETLLVSIFATAFVDGSANTAERLLVVEDITDRKKADLRINNLARLVTEDPNPVMRLSVEGHILYANPASAEILREWDCAVGDVVPVFWRKPIGEAFHHRRKEYIDQKAGSRYYAFVVVPVESEQYVNLYARDITDRRKMLETIQESEERYRAVAETATDVIAIFDTHHTILYVNQAVEQVFGHTPEGILGKSFAVFIASPWWQANKWQFQTYLEKGDRRAGWNSIILPGVHANGKEIPLEVSIGEFVRDGEQSYTAIIRDVSERRLLEEQLFQSQKMESIGTLVGGIAHDFNNILNNMLGFIQQIKKYPGDPEKIRRYVETLEKSGTRGADLASQLLSFARGKRHQDEPVDLREVINEIVTIARETFPRAIHTAVEMEPYLCSVLGDRGELYQAILNLCVNARDAMATVEKRSEQHTLTIRARCLEVGKDVSPMVFQRQVIAERDCVEVTVSDTGCGIANEIREKIFDPFFTTKEKGKGTGLGLSVVYNIIRNHHGAIFMETEVGVGTTFRILLPAVKTSASAQKREEELNLRGNNEMILLVDDELPMQELGKELLEENNYRVLMASDGKEALEIYKTHGQEIDLVVLDLIMPKLDGGSAYLELKKINPHVKAFFCTGYTSDQVITSLLAEENLRALQKPFRTNEFLSTVRDVLAGR